MFGMNIMNFVLLLQMDSNAEHVRICPGFLLEQRPQLELVKGAVTLMDVNGVHFKTGVFKIETVPDLDYRIEISVRT